MQNRRSATWAHSLFMTTLATVYLSSPVSFAEEMVGESTSTAINQSVSNEIKNESSQRKWGIQAVTDNFVSSAAFSRLGHAKIGEGDQTVTARNYVGPQYKPNSKTTFGFRQYWDHTFGDNVAKPDTQGWSVLTASHKFEGWLGSSELVPLFWA